MTPSPVQSRVPDRSRRPLPGVLPPLVLPPVQKGRLSNGLPVWLVEQHTNPQVVLSIVLGSGASSDPAGGSGTATLTAELLETGTKTRDALNLSSSVEFIGASLNFRAGADATFGTLMTLRRHMETGIRLFTDVLVNPTFPEQEFERLKKQRLTSLLQQLDRPASIAGNAIMRIIYGVEHPYGNDPAGTPATISALSREGIAAFYGAHYRPSNATIIVVGDTSMEEVLPLLERELGSWAGAPVPRSPEVPGPEAAPGGVYLIDRPGAPQAEIRMGARALRRNSPEYFPATVLNRVLGGQFSSRINLNLREKRGLTYGAHSTFHFLKNPGPFIVSGGFTGSKTGEAVEQLLAEIGSMYRAGVTEAELEFSKKGLTGGFALSFETPYHVAAALQSIVLYGLPEDYFEHYLPDLGSVTAGDVMRAARLTLDPGAMHIVVVADAHDARSALASLGRGDVIMLDPGSLTGVSG